jgi:hypothetical protein
MSKLNLKIWDQVKETDPSKTKDYKGAGGFTGTAINPTYLVQKATKIWGPIGLNWGYEIKEDRFDQGAPIIDAETQIPTGTCYQTHTIKIELWYMQEEKRATVTHYGHTPFVYRNKYGIQMDYEAPKKSLTDALKKCLSMLGFSADIMLGDFEDPDYKQELEDKARVEKAEDKIKEVEVIKSEQKEWLDKHCETMSKAASMHELETVFKIVAKTLRSRNDEEGIKQATKAKDIRKQELTEKTGAAAA